MRKPYFKREHGPGPLRASVERRVRFEECDMLGIMWHGNYASYFEDAREALGDKYGISYMRFKEAGVVTPIVSFHIDYLQTLEYRKTYSIHAIMHWTEAAKVNIEYEIVAPDGQLATRGHSVQLLVDVEGQLLFAPPDFYASFLRRWQEGELR